jgi:hypothetical protein
MTLGYYFSEKVKSEETYNVIEVLYDVHFIISKIIQLFALTLIGRAEVSASSCGTRTDSEKCQDNKATCLSACVCVCVFCKNRSSSSSSSLFTNNHYKQTILVSCSGVIVNVEVG